MVTWLFQPERKLRTDEARSQPKDKTCVVCGGWLLRLAARQSAAPYRWQPVGYICDLCNATYLELMR